MPEPREAAPWPYTSLLLFGFFGADTPEGRRLARRTTGALALTVASLIGLQIVSPGGPAAAVLALLAPVGVVGVGVAYARYLAALDELARLLQLKAFALAYGVVMALGMAGVAVAMAGGWRLGARGLYSLLVLAEPLRGAALAYLAKRHA